MIPLKPIVFMRKGMWFAVAGGTGYVYIKEYRLWVRALSQASVLTYLVTAIRTMTAYQVKGLKNASIHE